MDRADCPVHRPSPVDMESSMEDFVKSIEANSEKFGICKIIPPSSWRPCGDGYVGQDGQMSIGRIQQKFAPSKETVVSGFYSGTYKALRKQTVQAFQKEAEAVFNTTSVACAEDELAGIEQDYWRNVTRPTMYGADNEGSLFDRDIKEWNPATLESCLSRGLAAAPTEDRLKGVNTPYLYYGRWRSTFAWHTEDMELHSLNYLHYGAPKVWYCVSPIHKEKMDTFLSNTLYAQHRQCKDFMRHKTVMIRPDVLEAHGIPVQKVVQHPGDFIINFPGAYHAGFNVGFNCAESTNFATASWIERGATANFCQCSPEEQSVHLDMGLFLAQAPDDHAQALVRQWVNKHKASLVQKSLKKKSMKKKLVSSSRGSYDALASHHDCSNWQQEGFKPVCKAAEQATVQLLGAAQGAGRGKAAGQLANHRKCGPLRKPAMSRKHIKKALQHSKAELSSGGKADSKVAAAMLKMAKRAELVPSAAAKMPQLQPISSSVKSLFKPLQAVESHANIRGRPKSSTKARVAAIDIAMQELDPRLDVSAQSDHMQTQQHDVTDAVDQPFGSAAPADTQLLGKRKRSAPTTAMPEEGMNPEEALKAMHHQIAAQYGQYTSDGRPTKKAKQAATPQLPHIKPAQHIQQAAGQHAQQAQPVKYTQQEQPTHQVVLMQHLPTQQVQTEDPEPSNSACTELQSDALRSNKGPRVSQATAQTFFIGSQVASPPSLILPVKWVIRRNRSHRKTRRADLAHALAFLPQPSGQIR